MLREILIAYRLSIKQIILTNENTICRVNFRGPLIIKIRQFFFTRYFSPSPKINAQVE